MTDAFTFDAAFCSGCKACQAACKDKNHLPLGVLWRRVYEISGGTWKKHGEAWSNTVFAYNLSMSCNHCVHPKCAGVCPTDAYSIRPDGIVLLDSTKCVGCGYCAWACPYGAPQYNADAGYMTKCDLCVDNLEQGLPPACVAACPLRVLNYGESQNEHQIGLWDTPPERHPYPLPGYSHTAPRLAIRPHAAMSMAEKKSVANLEEIKPRHLSGWEEVPLILFTLLGQMAVGGFWAMAWMFPSLGNGSPIGRLLSLLIIGACLGGAVLASLAHLGTKKNAWRVLTHLRKSSLSREILFTGLFGVGWLICTLQQWTQHNIPISWVVLTALLGFVLVYNMSRVYRLPAAPGWNTWRTNAGFLVSAVLLGESLMAALLLYESKNAGVQIPSGLLVIINGSILILLLAQLGLMRRLSFDVVQQNVRSVFIFGGVALALVSLLLSNLHAARASTFALIIVLVEEAFGRWVFYQSRLES